MSTSLGPEKSTVRLPPGSLSSDDRWQRRLLPLMVRVVLALAVFFFLISLVQLTFLHWQLGQQSSSLVPEWAGGLVAVDDGATADPQTAKLGLAALLESEVTSRRYQMASVIMMAHIWIRYLGFVTGMAIAIIGSVFILGKLREPSTSLVGAEAQGIKLSLTSASPGLVLATLGTALMIVTVLARQEMQVRDTSLYSPFAPAAIEQQNLEPLPDIYTREGSSFEGVEP